MDSQKLKAKRNQTTQRILNAAAKVFSDVGFAGARVDEIAKSAGVNKATIYYHIGDKKALYAQVIHNLFGNAAERFAHNIKGTQPPEEKIKIYVRTLAGIVDQHPELAAIMLREHASGGKNFPEMVAQDLAHIISIITEILDEGAKKGVFIVTIPLIIHFMVIGAFVFLKMSSPIRSKFDPLAGTLKTINHDVAGDIAAEIEKLILNAVKK